MSLIKSAFAFICVLFASLSFADVMTHFNHIKNDPAALYAFLYEMPKGGELHYHLAGGAYPEAMLDLASGRNYCISEKNFVASKNNSTCEGMQSQEVYKHPEFYANIIKSWSMKDFVPGNESSHDHFFNSFAKFLTIVSDNHPELLVDIIQRAAQQNENYLELLILPDDATSVNFGSLIAPDSSFSEKRRILLANSDFQKNIKHTVLKTDEMLANAHSKMGCTPDSKAQQCKITVKFLYYVLREQEIDKLFAQALNAFEAVSRSSGNLVGVNLVQPEDGIISLRDYQKQMRVFEFLHQHYPKVHISLHAGELSSEATLPQNLRFHIHDAIRTGHAERIGHGSDIAYEDHANDILNTMKKQQIPVEINLTSNKVILNLYGSKHPIHFYLAHQVPVVLSTDDEGILRTDLTHEYVEAVITQGIDYMTLRQINRNALSYSFLPGESLWKHVGSDELVDACKQLNSISCKSFVKTSQKAQLQWGLEQQLLAFEQHYR